MSITMTQRAPATVAIGETAPVEVSFAFELGAFLADGAKAIGIESVDLSGTAMQVRLVGPSGETASTVSPPKTVADPRTAGTIDLGSTAFDVPTAAPGAAAVVLGDATISVRTAPKDVSFSASCKVPALPPLPYLFVVDPAAPKVTAPETSMISDDRSGTVDVAAGVEAHAGSTLGGWRVVRTLGDGTAGVEDGRLSWNLAEGSPGLDVVWETCAVPAPTTTTTAAPTSSTTTTTVATDPVAVTDGDETAQAAEPVTDPSTDPAETTTTASGADTATHCAQGVVKVRPKLHSEVMSATADSGTSSAQSPAAPITFTG
jgi:hypothetical protein